MLTLRIVALAISLLVGITVAGKEFHFTLTKEELSHYFGTTLVEQVPDYDFIPAHTIIERGATADSRNITLTAFGQEYQLYLTKNKNLMSPGCTINQIYSNGTKDSVPCSVVENCHYIGHSESHPGSTVAVSTCDGLHGVISALDHDVYIHPQLRVHQGGGSSGGDHLVVRRSAQREKILLDEDRLIIRRSPRRYLESRVVVAHDSQLFHGSDTTRFVTTIMNMAAKIFLDPSLGSSKLYLALVDLTILMDDTSGLKIVADSGDLLETFCRWQRNNDVADESDPKHPDVSILITKKDLEKNGDQTNVGLGTMGGVCYTDRKCTVNQDSGLDTAFTIVHELGHTLGMKHDGDGNQCPENKFIMSPYGSATSNTARWSTCSEQYLRAYLTGVSCLSDVPSRSAVKVYENIEENPGIKYSANAQCTLFFGRTSETCVRKKNPCRADCINPSTKQCITYAASFVDGTECGGRNWCINGQCVSMTQNAPRQVDGGWSSWDSQWSSCSRSCGGGVTLKKRTCTNPEPRFGGRPCPGKPYQAKMCNLQPCVTSQHQFLEEQCASTNKNLVHGKHYHFAPPLIGESDCRLECEAAEDKLIYTRAEASADGTVCHVSSAAFESRCVQGTCEGFGCDGVLGSQAKFDNCGDCNGSGNRCTAHPGKYTENHPGEYHTILTIPVGSTGITVTNNNGYNYLGVKINGRGVLGQNKQKASSGTYGRSRVVIEYRATPERVEIVGPTTAIVEVDVYQQYDATKYMGVTPDVSFVYHTPNGGTSDQANFKWHVTTGQCSASCGTGTQMRTAKCARKSDNVEVEDYHCDIYQKPSEISVFCNIHPCSPEWHASSWGNCSKKCGGGTHTRTVQCVTVQGSNYTAVSDSRCNAARKPTTAKACNPLACEATGDCSDKLDCREYGNQVCSNYPEWSKLNCPKHCNLCPEGKPCEDLEDCTAYGDGVCTGYRGWAQINCRKHCGFCTSGGSGVIVNGGSCVDQVNCGDYQDDICTNPTYAQWSREHCPKWCNLCDKSISHGSSNTHTQAKNDSCQDTANCACTDALSDCADYGRSACTGDYEPWARTNCKLYCNYCDAVHVSTNSGSSQQGGSNHGTSGSGSNVQSSSTNVVSSDPCRDIEKCNEYSDNVCTEYQPWARKNCARHCKFCEPCKDAITDCSAYGRSSCIGVYEPWARQKCKLFCNYCGGNSTTVTRRTTQAITTTHRTTPAALGTTIVVTSDPCQDLERCVEYGGDVCTAYAAWSKINCRRHCKFCQPCKDAISDCADYGKQACTGSYVPWAKQNCRLYCNLCGMEGTTTTTTSTTTTTPPPTTVLASSDRCRDKINDCSSYGSNMCTTYAPWAKINCRRHCKFCHPCADKLSDCASYGKNACTGQYRAWAQLKCPLYCNLCGSRKKRSTREERAPEKVGPLGRDVVEINRMNRADRLEMNLMNTAGNNGIVLVPSKISNSSEARIPEPHSQSQNLVPSKAHRVPEIVHTNSVGEVPDEVGGVLLQPIEEYSVGRVPTGMSSMNEMGKIPPEEIGNKEENLLDELKKLKNSVDGNLKM